MYIWNVFKWYTSCAHNSLWLNDTILYAMTDKLSANYIIVWTPCCCVLSTECTHSRKTHTFYLLQTCSDAMMQTQRYYSIWWRVAANHFCDSFIYGNGVFIFGGTSHERRLGTISQRYSAHTSRRDNLLFDLHNCVFIKTIQTRRMERRPRTKHDDDNLVEGRRVTGMG